MRQIKFFAITSLFAIAASSFAVNAQDAVPKHLQLARDFVANIKPENNLYTHKNRHSRMPGEKGSTDYVVNGDCSSFVEDMFNKTKSGVMEQLTTKKFKSRYSINDMIPAIEKEEGFKRITKVEDIREGDVLGWLFLDMRGHSGDGHIMFVDAAPVKVKSAFSFGWNSAAYDLKIIDTSSEIKSDDDTRAPTNSTGVGRTTIRIYADEKTGDIKGVAFKTGKQKIRVQDSDWHIVVGRPNIVAQQ